MSLHARARVCVGEREIRVMSERMSDPQKDAPLNPSRLSPSPLSPSHLLSSASSALLHLLFAVSFQTLENRHVAFSSTLSIFHKEKQRHKDETQKR